MDSHVYKLVELVGSSPLSIEDAVKSAVQRASTTVKHLRWFQITEVRGHIEENQVAHWQVSLKVGFTVEPTPAAPTTEP